MPLDTHLAAAHRMASHQAFARGHFASAGKPEIFPEMAFFGSDLRQAIHPLNHFNQAFLAFALLPAGGRDLNAQGFGSLEQGNPRSDLTFLTVEMKSNTHPGSNLMVAIE
jgi:hypothetical protein